MSNSSSDKPRVIPAINTGGRGWDLFLAIAEASLQGMGLLAVGGNFYGPLQNDDFPELLIALLAFFVMNLETSYDLHKERDEVYEQALPMKAFYWIVFVVMCASTLAAGCLVVLTAYKLENVPLNMIRNIATVVLFVPALLHLVYRSVLYVISERTRAMFYMRSEGAPLPSTARPMPGPHNQEQKERAMMSRTRRSPKAFMSVWDRIIFPAIQRYCREVTVSCADIEAARNRIRSEYNRLDKQCSELYMADPFKPLNQRKVAACYAQAIIVARPLDIDLADERCTIPPKKEGRIAYECRPCFANERLAIHTSCSVLISFLRKAVGDERCHLTEKQRQEAEQRLDKGINLLQSVDEGEFVLNLERSLSFMSLKGSYNTPLLSCLFSYWEAQVLPPEVYAEVLRVFLLASGKQLDED